MKFIRYCSRPKQKPPSDLPDLDQRYHGNIRHQHGFTVNGLAASRNTPARCPNRHGSVLSPSSHWPLFHGPLVLAQRKPVGGSSQDLMLPCTTVISSLRCRRGSTTSSLQKTAHIPICSSAQPRPIGEDAISHRILPAPSHPKLIYSDRLIE